MFGLTRVYRIVIQQCSMSVMQAATRYSSAKVSAGAGVSSRSNPSVKVYQHASQPWVDHRKYPQRNNRTSWDGDGDGDGL